MEEDTVYITLFKKKKKNVPILKDRSVTLLIVGSDAIQSVKDFFVKIKAGDFFIYLFFTRNQKWIVEFWRKRPNPGIDLISALYGTAAMVHGSQ